MALSLSLLFTLGCKNPLGSNSTDDEYHPGIYASPSHSEISTSLSSVAPGSSTTVSLQVRDQNGAIFSAPVNVQFSISGGTNTGTLGTITYIGSGRYQTSFQATSIGAPFTVSASLDDEPVVSSEPVIVVEYPSPIIALILSNTIGTWGNVPITISGSGFRAGASVTVDGSSCPVTSLTSTSIICTAPAHAAGVVAVTLTNTDAKYVSVTSGLTYSAENFNYTEHYYGSSSPRGGTDGIGRGARFNQPLGLATDGSNLYVADSYNHTIRKIDILTLQVTTIAGANGIPGTTDGTGTNARFNIPSGLSTDGTNLYIADTGNHSIRKMVLSTGVVTTLAGNPGVYGGTTGVGTAATFFYPYGVLLDSGDSDILYITDSVNGVIRKLVISTQTVSAFAGSNQLQYPNLNCTQSSPCYTVDNITTMFYNPYSMITDGTNIFLIDAQEINKIVIATQANTVLAGSAYAFNGMIDAVGTAARFNGPTGMVSDGTNIYVSDSLNRVIRQIDIASKAVSTYSGTAGTAASVDGPIASAKYDTPGAMAKIGDVIYFIEMRLGQIRTIDLVSGNVSTIIGY